MVQAKPESETAKAFGGIIRTLVGEHGETQQPETLATAINE